MENEDTIVLCALLYRRLKSSGDARRKWTRDWLDASRGMCSTTGLVEELRIGDKYNFSNFLRMDESKFDCLLQSISSKISRTDSLMRACISARSKLIVTLRFLATGESYTSLAYQSRISKQAISRFVPVVLDAIYNSLRDTVLKVSTLNSNKNTCIYILVYFLVFYI